MTKSAEVPGTDRAPFLGVALSLGLIGGASGNMGGPWFILPAALVGVLAAFALAWVARRMRPRGDIWLRRVLFITTLFAAMVTGAGIMGQSLATAALGSDPGFFTAMLRGPVGLAESLPFYVLNTPLEWIFVPLTVFLAWNQPRLRGLLAAILVVWTFHRVWTYLVFAPQVIAWSQGADPFTTEQFEAAKTWVGLSWIRVLFDLSTSALLLSVLTRSRQET